EPAAWVVTVVAVEVDAEVDAEPTRGPTTEPAAGPATGALAGFSGIETRGTLAVSGAAGAHSGAALATSVSMFVRRASCSPHGSNPNIACAPAVASPPTSASFHKRSRIEGSASRNR